MTMQEKAERMIEETLDLLRNKPVNSTLIEHWFLLDDAWKSVRELPQPLQEGEGLSYILERASLPVSEHDLLLGRFVDKVPNEAEEKRFQELWKDGERPRRNPISRYNGGHITLDMGQVLKHGIKGYLKRCQEKIDAVRGTVLFRWNGGIRSSFSFPECCLCTKPAVGISSGIARPPERRDKPRWRTSVQR